MPKTIPAKYIFLDIEGFTHNRSGEAQSDIIQTLNGIVESVIHKYGITKDHILFLPAGDGICAALLNIESPYDIHLSIALDIIAEVHRYDVGAATDEMRRFKVRVGLNSNTDNLITDINGNRNIAGEGVNLAARVMQLADGNQILVSEPVFEVLNRYGKYPASFKPFRAKVKHGLELPVYQFIGEGHAGLSTLPPSFLSDSAEDAAYGERTFFPAAPRPERRRQERPADTTRSFTQIPPAAAITQPSITPENAAVTFVPDQTQSYSKGILPENAGAEAATETAGAAAGGSKWIKANTERKTEPLSFLSHPDGPKKGRSPALMAALLLLLLGGGAILGIWFWRRGGETADVAANQPTTTVGTANGAPHSENAPAAASSRTANLAPNQATTAGGGNNPASPKEGAGSKPRTAAGPTALAPVNRSTNEPAPPRAAVRRTFVRPMTALPQRSIVQRIVAQRPQPKRQPVKAANSQRKIDIDDVIGGKKTDVLRRVNIDDIINQ